MKKSVYWAIHYENRQPHHIIVVYQDGTRDTWYRASTPAATWKSKLRTAIRRTNKQIPRP